MLHCVDRALICGVTVLHSVVIVLIVVLRCSTVLLQAPVW